QAVVTCSAGENALEFTRVEPDGRASMNTFSGSAFLDALRFVSDPKNKRLPDRPAATPSDSLPVADWTPALAKRVVEMGEKAGAPGKQTVVLAGTPPSALPSFDAAEKIAARFDWPQPAKGEKPAPLAEVKAIEGEFRLPPLKPELPDFGVAEQPFSADVMKDYAADLKIEDIRKDKDKYPLRVAVLRTLDKIREKWSGGAGAQRLRKSVEGPINDALKADVKREQEFWALSIAELEVELLELEGLKAKREEEASKRWQAHYDFALASLKARLAYMNEYNKVLGNLVTEALPPLDAKLGQDGYALVASETLKSGKDVKKLAEDAQTLFAEIATKYKGTPWALQAKQEKTVVIGLNWKPAALKDAK
ncbi:MAG: hypothetical protein K2V38_26925, partial [Gemmataceae bacterium]|nr:hypothetical protein [Gemmataceae bacterium]